MSESNVEDGPQVGDFRLRLTPAGKGWRWTVETLVRGTHENFWYESILFDGTRKGWARTFEKAARKGTNALHRAYANEDFEVLMKRHREMGEVIL